MANLFIRTKNIERSAFLWNMISSMLMAFQSVIMLAVLTHAVDLYSAGVFTIAYANANLFITIGKYGVRNFQVSDVNQEYGFGDYKLNRWITTIAMMLVSVGYVLIVGASRDYTWEKSIIIILMCAFKAVDSIEDVYHGRLQQMGRLDIASKLLGYRMISMIAVFAVCLLIFKNLLISLTITTVFTTGFFVVTMLSVKRALRAEQYMHEKTKKRRLRDLMISCFPLFLAAFLSMYIGNAPKYAIDAALSDELQAVYGFIAMPVFVVGLLNGFIFNPILKNVSDNWAEKRYKLFMKQIFRQTLIIVAITIVCLLGAYILGIPVLSALYNTDLKPYKMELLILLVGGGFLGLSGLFSIIITIIRYQKHLVVGYIIASIMAYILSPIFVERDGIRGASVLYVVLMAILALLFFVIMLLGIRKQKN